MKRLVLFLALALGLGLVLGPWLKDSAGTVLLVLGNPDAEHTTVRLRLWFALTLVAAALAVLALAWRSLSATGAALAGGTGLSAKARHRRARRQTVAGMIAFAEGHWAKAERLLVTGRPGSDVPLLNSLMAAQAAQMQKADARRDEYLREAALAEPEAQIAVGLTQAQLQLRQGQKELALATLNHVRSLAPKHPYVLKLLKKLHAQFEDWPALKALLPELAKHKLLADDEFAALEERVHAALLRMEAARGREALSAFWQGLERKIQHKPGLLAQYAEALQAAGAGREAEPLLRAALKKHYHPRLAEAYCRLDGAEAGQQLALAETWLKPETRQADLLLGLARLAMRATLWGKARAYLEEALSQSPSAEGWWLLARVQEQTGDRAGAEASCRRGLAQAVGAGA